jgi:hypothetical protein
VTEGKTAAMAATLTVVAGIAELGQNLTVGSRIAAARNSGETGLALRMCLFGLDSPSLACDRKSRRRRLKDKR